VFNRGTPQEVLEQREGEIKRRDRIIESKDDETRKALERLSQIYKDREDKLIADMNDKEETYLEHIKKVEDKLKGKKKTKEEIEIDKITKKVIEQLHNGKKKSKKKGRS